MALSNIFNEPRRELTEQLVGTLTFVGAAVAGFAVAFPFGWVIYRLALWSWAHRDPKSTTDFAGHCAGWVFSLLLGAVILVLVFKFIHWVGEVVCDWFEDRGIFLRPIDRGR